MRALLLALMTFLGGCAYYEDLPKPPVAPKAIVATIHGDTRFARHERIVAEYALNEWNRVSDGRINLAMAWDYDDARFLELSKQPHMVRASANSVGSNVAGDVRENEIRIIPERCPDLAACVLHEVGHLAGLGHVARKEHAVMSPWNPGSEFLQEDIEACRRAGLCPPAASRTTTTVSVTIDPNIARVEPEYPR